MALDMFIDIPPVKGEARDATHKDKIDVLAWSWGMSNSGSAHVGGGAGAGKVNVQDLSFTKYIDKASTFLQAACCTGKHFDNATLIVRKAGDKPLEYLTIEMTEVFITSVSTGGSGGEDRLTENVTLNFSKVKVIYKSQSKTGVADKNPDFTFDIAANEKT